MKPDDPTLIDDGGSTGSGARYGKYRILGRIGEGGMGVVYKALDEELGRTVALKFLPPDTNGNPAARERFLREARAASALDHVHIGTIHGIEEAGDGRRFIVMAYYEGQDLAEFTRMAGGRLNPAQALKIVAQVASGLAEAHARGIIHRDIKPSNILVTRRGVVKIVDFGLAQMQGAGQLTQDGARMGTPAYMSPEQAMGEPADDRTDIWSLGVVLHELLTGDRPFDAGSVAGTLYQVVHEEPHFMELVPDAIRPVLGRMLAKRPEDRFSTVAELREELDRLASTPLDALVSTAPLPRPRMGAGRGRKALQGALAASLLLTLGAGSVWLFQRSRSVVPSAAGSPGIGDASARYLQGVALMKRWDKEGQLDRAIRLLEESVRQNPSFALGHARLAEAHRIRYALTRDRKALETAASHASEAVRLNPDLAPVQVAMGRVQAALGNQDLAMASLERALQLDANDPEAHQALARQYERAGRLADAEKSFRRAVELDPDDLAAHDAFGNFLFRQSRFPEAIREWQAVIRLAPDHSAALVNLSSALCETGRVAEAIEISTQLVKVKPGVMAWTNLGTAYSRAQRYAEAVNAYKKALEIDGSDPMTWGNLGFVYSWMGGREPQAREAFRKAIDLGEARRKDSPRDAFLHSDLALYYAKTGQQGLALERMATALNLAPKGPEIQAAAAETYEILGQRSQAEAAARRALALGYPRQRMERNQELAALLREAREKRLF